MTTEPPEKLLERMDKTTSEDVMAVLAWDTEGTKVIRPLISPELFESHILQEMATLAIDFFDEYGEAIKDHLPDMLDNILSGDDERKASVYRRTLNNLFEAKGNINTPYVIKRLKEWVSGQMLKIAILSATEKIEAGDRLAAEDILERRQSALPRVAMFNADAARVGRLDEPLPPEPWLIENYLPLRKAGGLVAVGGTGKTTFTLFEAAHIALATRGEDWAHLYGRRIENPGSTVFVSVEDDRKTLKYRLQQIALALRLSDAERKVLEESIFIEDLVGMSERLVEPDMLGRLRPTSMGDRIIKAYRDRNVVCINLDPNNLLGPGERYVNDGEAAVMVEGMRIARELNCTVRIVAHVAKVIARGGIVDQYAARGGAAFADNSRFQAMLVAHEVEPTRGEKLVVPRGITALDVKDGRALRLHLTKVSAAPPQKEPLWIVRQGYQFAYHASDNRSREDRRQDDEAQKRIALLDLVEKLVKEGIHLSPTQFADQYAEDLDIGRDTVRKHISVLLASGELAQLDLPPFERQGARTKYLARRTA